MSGRVRQLRGIHPKARPTHPLLHSSLEGPGQEGSGVSQEGAAALRGKPAASAQALAQSWGTAASPGRWVPRDTQLGKACLGECALPTIPAGLLRPHKTRNILPGPHALGKEFPKTMCPNFSPGWVLSKWSHSCSPPSWAPFPSPSLCPPLCLEAQTGDFPHTFSAQPHWVFRLPNSILNHFPFWACGKDPGTALVPFMDIKPTPLVYPKSLSSILLFHSPIFFSILAPRTVYLFLCSRWAVLLLAPALWSKTPPLPQAPS